MAIPTKSDFLRLSRAGSLGNFLRCYDTVDAVLRSDYDDWLTIRNRSAASPHFVPWCHSRVGLPGYDFVVLARNRLLRNGAREEDLYFQQAPPPWALRKIQFELIPDERYLHYELETREPLRGIRERTRPVTGLAADTILRTYLSPSGYDDIQALRDLHPTSTIEASEFDRPVGEMHRKLLVWEVRDF